MKKLNITKTEAYIKKVQPTLEGAYTDMLKQLGKDEKLPTAFVAANDTIALGSIKALKQQGVVIPDQVLIIGFDDIPFCMMLDKSLTTMRVNKEKLGEVAVNLLDSKIKNPSDECVKIKLEIDF